jgi:hypothetical protein
MQEHHTSVSEYLSLPTPSASQEPGWTTQPVNKEGQPTDNPNERWYHPETGRLMQKGITQALRFTVQDSALLRTPVASEAEGGAVAPEVAKANGQTLRLSGQMIDLVAPDQLPKLPTPTVSDQYTANLASTQQKPGSMHSVTLAQVFHKTDLFPTPQVDDSKNTGHNQTRRATLASKVWSEKQDQVKLFPTLRASDSYERRNQKTMDRIARDGGDMTMTTLARTTTDWGKFEPAIRRWEAILYRPAPEPTKPDGKEGNHRLSSKFTEWMMGLPDGWITDIGLKRNDELKACGNGVVPQQAELALSLLGIKEIIREN